MHAGYISRRIGALFRKQRYLMVALLLLPRNAGYENWKVLPDILAFDSHSYSICSDSLFRSDVELAGLIRHEIFVVPPMLAFDALLPQHFQHGKFKAEIRVRV